MRIVIFGGCGFIGKNIALGFAREGYNVVVIDKCNDTTGLLQQNNIEFEECDFLLEEDFSRYVQAKDIVIHLISTSVPGSSNKDMVLDAKNNLMPTLELIKACGEKKVSKFIFSSSGGQVYGIPQSVPIDEHHITVPRSAYGVHKLAIEKYLMLSEVLYGLSVGILRIANPYGPGQRPYIGQGIIPTYIASAMQGKEVEIWGDGTSTRDYIFIDDLVNAFVKMAEYNGNKHVFNIGSSVGNSINDIIDVVERITNIELIKKYIQVKEFDVKANILNCDKAKEELGWNPSVSLEDGVRNMVNSWSNDSQSFVIGRE